MLLRRAQAHERLQEFEKALTDVTAALEVCMCSCSPLGWCRSGSKQAQLGASVEWAVVNESAALQPNPRVDKGLDIRSGDAVPFTRLNNRYNGCTPPLRGWRRVPCCIIAERGTERRQR